MVSVLFVCLGNTCRSPAAEEILRQLHKKKNLPLDLHVDSSGIGDWHTGHLPSESMRAAAERRGLILSGRSKQFKMEDFDHFDYIYAADNTVLQELYRRADSLDRKAKVHLFTEHSKTYYHEEIPDPYSQGGEAFDLVLNMLEECCEGILHHIKES